MKGSNKNEKISLRSIQGQMLNGSTLYYLGQAKNGLPVTEFAPLLAWAMTATKKGKFVALKLRDALYPKHISSLKANPLLAPSSLERELWWFNALMLANVKRIQRYLQLSHLFEISLIEGEAEACYDVLDTVESEFGHSIWLIESRIAALQYFEGVESQKKYVRELKANAQSNVPWFALTFSKRNEEPTTFFRYVNQTLEIITGLEDLGFQAHLKYQAVGIVSKDPEDLLSLLHYETDGTLIDAYNAFFTVLKICIIDEAHEAHATAATCLTKLYGKVPDDRLRRLMFIAEKCDFPSQLAFPNTSLVDSLISVSDDESNEPTFNDWPVAWKASANRMMERKTEPTKLTGLQGKVTLALYEIISKGASTEGALSETLKLCLNFRWLPFSGLLNTILMQELSSNPMMGTENALEQFVHSKYLDPELIGLLPSRIMAKYSNIVLSEYSMASFAIARTWASGIETTADIQGLKLKEDALLLLSSDRAYRLADYQSAITYGLKLNESPNIRYRRLACRLVASCYKELALTAELIDFVAKTVASDPGSTDLMPIQDCVTRLSKEVCKQLASHLSVPIIFSLNSRNYDDKFDKELSYAYEDFLIAHGWESPSQLRETTNRFGKDQLIYYLRYICVPRIIKVSSEFNGSIALQNERLAVCSLLLELDPQNAKIYESEIKEITRAQAIRRGVRHVEQSKMSIDVPALRKWADKKLKESFLRYRAMIKAGIIPSEEFEKAYIQLLADGKPLPSELLKVPTDEAGTLLIDIVGLILSEATINPMHGLDCYLSMRIRHGALSGQLRGPLELENIITKRKGENGSYASNDFWLDQLANLNQSTKDQIDLSLCIFSARYDHLITSITDELIQIRSPEKPKGLFDIYISVFQLHVFASSIHGETEFDSFFDSFINVFWRSVEFSLQGVRKTIEDSLKPQINEIFNTLQTSISQASPSNHIAELSRAIRTAHTNSLQALEQVKDWFKLPTPRAEPFFEVEELIDVGLQCVQRIHKDFTPEVKKDIAELPPIANALTMFSDIFFILFDNVRRYSDTNDSPEISIKIERDDPDSVVLSVTNKVSANENFERSSARIEAIKSSIANGDYHESVNSEGGTGLIKLKKIIGTSQFLDFGYANSGEFVVKFNLPLREITI